MTDRSKLRLKKLPVTLSVCRLSSFAGLDLSGDIFFLAKTDEEISLVCTADAVPEGTEAREDGFGAFRIEGVLDFSLTGILSDLTTVLARDGIGIFAVSTYNTDYILVKAEKLDRALRVLAEAGYTVLP